MPYAIDLDYYNAPKYGKLISGDCFLSDKTEDGRIVATIADGLGSGVKANVLSQITSCLAQKFMIADVESVHAANTIMEILPVCSKRKISYSTFTTISINSDGFAKVFEFDNPEFICFKGDEVFNITKKVAKINTDFRKSNIYISEFFLQPGDRIIFFSDGVTQSGMGSDKYPLGWGMENLIKFVKAELRFNLNISADELSKKIVNRAVENDNFSPKDDITCCVAYYRKSKELLLVSGPPYKKHSDQKLVEKFVNFTGKKIISGGTTSQFIANALNLDIKVDLNDINTDIPPRSYMDGADLVTEGMLTLNKVVKILEEGSVKHIKNIDAAHKMVKYLLESDKIYCLVGTAINEAHQSPNMPVEMGLRRITVNKLASILRKKYLKEVIIEYI